MIHRYFVGGLSLLIFLIVILSLVQRKNQHPLLVPFILLALLFFQAALGMWTVTWKLLPVVVMGHLLGGISIFCLLWLLTLQCAHPDMIKHDSWQRFKPWAVVGLVIVFCQVALGGWVSSNYASLICSQFPGCNGNLLPLPALDFHSAFNVLSPIGANYQGGLLDTTARITIQMTHRLGAFITFIYIGLLSLTLLISRAGKGLGWIAVLMLILLIAQCTLGILNVLFLLPLHVALSHNAFAALLLASVVTLNYWLFCKR
jgi:cytochrome c oxidase assembly protein subunit 15